MAPEELEVLYRACLHAGLVLRDETATPDDIGPNDVCSLNLFRIGTEHCNDRVAGLIVDYLDGRCSPVTYDEARGLILSDKDVHFGLMREVVGEVVRRAMSWLVLGCLPMRPTRRKGLLNLRVSRRIHVSINMTQPVIGMPTSMITNCLSKVMRPRWIRCGAHSSVGVRSCRQVENKNIGPITCSSMTTTRALKRMFWMIRPGDMTFLSMR